MPGKPAQFFAHDSSTLRSVHLAVDLERFTLRILPELGGFTRFRAVTF
jgi:hypothetical protein